MSIDYKKISINQMELALKSLQAPDEQSVDGKTETNGERDPD